MMNPLSVYDCLRWEKISSQLTREVDDHDTPRPVHHFERNAENQLDEYVEEHVGDAKPGNRILGFASGNFHHAGRWLESAHRPQWTWKVLLFTDILISKAFSNCSSNFQGKTVLVQLLLLEPLILWRRESSSKIWMIWTILDLWTDVRPGAPK